MEQMNLCGYHVGEVSDGLITKTINLSRYTFESGGSPTNQGAERINSYYQELETSTHGNTTAKDLQEFINSANSNGGYYIGRYEASDSITTSPRTSSASKTNTMASKKYGFAYNYVTQSQAAELCRNMYNSTSYTSDLVNSYAWDTAIVFIQSFEASNYADYDASNGGELLKTGMSGDEQLNINDMASNVREWTTESSVYMGYPNVCRGGDFNQYYRYTAYRDYSEIYLENERSGFRPLLYM